MQARSLLTREKKAYEDAFPRMHCLTVHIRPKREASCMKMGASGLVKKKDPA